MPEDRAWLLPVLVVVGVAALIASTRSPATRDACALTTDPVAAPVATTRLRALEHYLDPELGFSLAIPHGWTAVVAAETDEQLAMLEPGYAVGFESRPEHATDRYADYLMIEVLPGRDSGRFASDGRTRRETVIDGRRGWRERLELVAEPAEAVRVELVVYQAELVGLGYTIGFYAVGEPAREALLADAFEAMLRTFSLHRPPFATS